MSSASNQSRRSALWVLAGLVVLGLLIASTRTCLRVGFTSGLWLNQCPDGALRQTVQLSAPALHRGAKSTVTVRSLVHYATGQGEQLSTEPITRFVPALVLQSPTQKWPLEPAKGWQRNSDSMSAEVELPVVPDGDYVLHADVNSAAGASTVDVPVALYTPARVHVLTDRPLYEPGNTVKFRAVALKASDLTPLDQRPGKWRVTDATGEVLLEEKAAAGAWGVVSGSFPLDKQAASGTWSVTWVSGATSETRQFTVKPFTLPRFRIEAHAQKPFYRKRDKPVLTGTVTYASGAPVAKAKVELKFNIGGAWPPPASWVDGSAFTKTADVDASGAFSVTLPQVPDDLQRQVTIAVALAAIDSTGDRVEGSASILLSEDPIAVSAVTELQDGLVQGFNNRLFLRATTADGAVLSGVTLNVKRLWEPTDKGIDTAVDEDGVGVLQIDPGPPVNVVIPAMPFRPPPKEPAVSLSNLEEMLGDDEPSLADRLTFDRALHSLDSCAQYVGADGNDVVLGLTVGTSGHIEGLASGQGRLSECVRTKVQTLSFGAGPVRLYQASWSFNDSDLPRIEGSVVASPGGEADDLVRTVITGAIEGARDCLPPTVPSLELNQQLLWSAKAFKTALTTSWAPRAEGKPLPDAVMACLKSRLTGLHFTEQKSDGNEGVGLPQQDAVGVITFTITAPARYEASRPQPTIQEGYEFLVTARAKNELIGSTRVLINPGRIPDLRLRASAQLVNPNDTVTVELLRGPDYTRELPKKIWLQHNFRNIEADVDEKTRSATFTIPPELEGWASVQYEQAQVFLFIRPHSQLGVTVAPEKPRYAPGQTAQLNIQTRVGGTPGPAAVGLFGVDESLSQLAPLPGADELSG